MSAPLYEDTLVRAQLAPDPAVNGHIIITTQRDAKRLSDLSSEESAHLFLVANYTAAILFQGLRAEGTNIILNEEGERPTLHVIARRTDDGLDFQWQPTRLEDGAMDEAAERIRDKLFGLGKKEEVKKEERPKDNTPQDKEQQEKPSDTGKDDPVSKAEERENYLIKQLIRIP